MPREFGSENKVSHRSLSAIKQHFETINGLTEQQKKDLPFYAGKSHIDWYISTVDAMINRLDKEALRVRIRKCHRTDDWFCKQCDIKDKCTKKANLTKSMVQTCNYA